MTHRFLLLLSLFMLSLGCGSSTLPEVNEPPRSTLTTDNSDELIGTENHPCDSSGGCFDGLHCEDGICVLDAVIDAGTVEGSVDGSMSDAGSSDGSSEGSMSDAGSSDGSSEGSMSDAGSSDGSSDNLYRYIENAEFEEEDTATGWPVGWTIDPQVSTEYNLISGTDARGNLMEIDRPISTVSGHWAFMQQSRNVRVNNCSHLTLSGEVQPMEQSLSSPGSSQGEFPVHIRIIYEDDMAQLHTYQLGVYYLGAEVSSYTVPVNQCASHLGTCTNFQTIKVDQNEWYTLPNIDLMALSPAPHKLTGFRLGSSGHTFKGRFNNVQLTGSDAATCGILE
jgi:hypothetical protein